MSRAEHHVLYRFFNDEAELLYVGITNDPVHRFSNHAYTKPWFAEAAAATMTHYPTRGELIAAERQAIERERPQYNRAHSVLPQPPAAHIKPLKKRGPGFNSHANSFPRPDAIALEDLSPTEKALLKDRRWDEHTTRQEQQLAQLRTHLQRPPADT